MPLLCVNCISQLRRMAHPCDFISCKGGAFEFSFLRTRGPHRNELGGPSSVFEGGAFSFFPVWRLRRFRFARHQALRSISRTPDIVFVPHVPNAVDLFHQYVSAATTQSTKMIDIEHRLGTGWVETNARELNQSHISRESFLKLR